MKKAIFITIIAVVLASCASYKSLDLNKLTTGMTKEEVVAAIGRPERVLAVNDRQEGYQEVLEYRTPYNEVYALEFWNDYLTGYEFLYDDVNYVAPVAPPTIWPSHGRPIYVIQGNNRPSRPSRPSQSNRPSQPSRPSTPSRPETNRPTTRPTTDTGSSTSRPTTNPSQDNNTSNTSRPSSDRSGSTR